MITSCCNQCLDLQYTLSTPSLTIWFLVLGFPHHTGSCCIRHILKFPNLIHAVKLHWKCTNSCCTEVLLWASFRTVCLSCNIMNTELSFSEIKGPVHIFECLWKHYAYVLRSNRLLQLFALSTRAQLFLKPQTCVLGSTESRVKFLVFPFYLTSPPITVAYTFSHFLSTLQVPSGLCVTSQGQVSEGNSAFETQPLFWLVVIGKC